MTPKPNPQISEPSAGYAEAVEQAVEARADPDVAESFKEFAELDEASAELEIAPPSAQIKQIAKQILTELTQEFPRYYMVGPDEEGGVAIETIGDTGRVLVVCDEYGVACFSIINGIKARMRCDSEVDKQLFDDFARSVLGKLK